MSRRGKQKAFKRSEIFKNVPESIKDELLEAYTSVTDTNPDFFLYQLPELFDMLSIPQCFTDDIVKCIEYYYEYMANTAIQFDYTNLKQFTALQLVKSYTISISVNKNEDIVDIIDIDKLIENTGKLIKFRDAYTHIYESWKLFIHAASKSNDHSEVQILNHKLNMLDLKSIKKTLRLDETRDRQVLSDSFLIDMLGCCSTNSDGSLNNYDFNKSKEGSCITIKDFAEILGNIGELD